MILLTVIIKTNVVFAQVDSPCSCSGFTVVGAPNTETDYSSLSSGLQPNNCYLVTGTLVMDVGNVTLYSVRLIMARGSSIRVDEDLTIINSYISGCGNMWRGIHVNVGVPIGVFYSVIESAEIGLFLDNGTALACQFNDFINNYIGIATGNPFDGDLFDKQIEQKQPILGCRFFTDGELPDPYPGQYYDPAWPVNSTIPFDQGYAAIYVSGTSSLNVGEVGASGTVRNKIFNMRNGIILRHSVADIFGTDFYDFEGGIPATLPEPLLDLNQNGIHSTEAFIRVEDNTMDNLQFGINTEQSWSYIHNNTLDMDVTVRGTRGIFALLPQALEISENVIYNGQRGIHLRSVNNSFDIRDNILIRDIFPLVNVGISVEGQRFVGNQSGFIRGNSIEITDGDGSVGIHVLNTSNFQITDNDVTYLIDQGQEHQCLGIVSSGSVGHMIARNTVTADAEYIDLANRGISSDMSAFNTFACNTIENFSSNLYFQGPHVQSVLDRNEILDADFGLFLEPPVFLGIQEHRGNQWSGTYGEFGAIISPEIMDPITSIQGSRFLVDTEDNSDFMPSSLSPAEGWFFDISGPEPTACLSIPDNPVLDPDTIENILLANFEFEKYEDEIKWSLKSDMFELVHLYPDLKSNAVLDSFYDAEIVNPLGKLIIWQNALASTFEIQEAAKLAKEDSILLRVFDAAYIDSLLGHKPSDSLTWLALRALKVDTISGIFDRWLGLLSDEFNASQTEYEEIADDLDNLTTGLGIEEDFRQALILQAQYKLGLGMSGSDSTDILSMMDVCPLESGRIMVTARELQSIYYDTLLLPDMSYCGSESPFRIRPFSPVTIADDVRVSPNPFSTQVDISSSFPMSEVNIYNSLGQVVYSYRGTRSALQVPTDTWRPGLYQMIASTEHGQIMKQIICLK